ncbi:MAG TPA: efflux RND transporter periplasmic adaptor subunit [Vicinamibacterales bacterium]|nr:efflux RND transporter periplasmic adaptor subunit [Vicinamibacterales bacterium]
MTAHAQRVVLALAVALMACRAKPAVEETESEAPVPVKVEAAETGSIRGVLHATGIITPAADGELIVVAPEAGRIAEISKAEGDRVARGDVLVRFEIPSLQAEVQRQAAEVQRAQAALANEKANQVRQRQLFERGIAARKEVEDADRMVADAEAAVGQAEASRAAAVTAAARTTVRATFNGVIAKRFHNPGDVVEAAASDPVLRVIDPRRLEVVASIPLSESPRVVIGASGWLKSGQSGLPDLPLKVVSRPAQVETGTATIPVRLAFAGQANLAAGTPVQVDIDAEQHTNVVLIPAPALVREGEETAVFVATGDKAQRRPVQTGLTDGTNIEILSGVKAGEMVIVDGQAGLPDEAKITIETGEDEDAEEKPADEKPEAGGGDKKEGGEK